MSEKTFQCRFRANRNDEWSKPESQTAPTRELAALWYSRTLGYDSKPVRSDSSLFVLDTGERKLFLDIKSR